MIRRIAAIAMLLLGVAALTPLFQMIWQMLRWTGPIDSDSYLFFLFCSLPAIGSALIVGAAWLFSSTRKVSA